MSKARIRKDLPTPLSVPSVEGPYGKSSVLMHIHGFDFLDDASNMPTANDILSRGARYFGFDYGDFANSYRANLDRFLEAENEYILATSYGTNRLLPNRTEFYYGIGELRSNNHEGARKAPNLMPTWSFNDPIKFSNAVPTQVALRTNMSIETMSRWSWTQEFGIDSWLTNAFLPRFESKTFSHSVFTSPGGTSVTDVIRLNSSDYPSVVLPNGDLLFYAIGGYNTETNEQFNGLCVQSATTGFVSNFEIKTVGGTSVQFNGEPGFFSGDYRDVSLFLANDNIFLSFNLRSYNSSNDSISLEDGVIESRLFKISLDGTVDELFFPTIFRYNRLFNINSELKNQKYDERNNKLAIVDNIGQVNGNVADIVSFTSQITSLGATASSLIVTRDSKIEERNAIDLILAPVYNGESTEYTQEQVTAFETSRNTLNDEISTLSSEILTIQSDITNLISMKDSKIVERDSYLSTIESLNYAVKTEGYPQSEIDSLVSAIDTLQTEMDTLASEAAILINAINGGLPGIQKFNSLVNVHYVAGTPGTTGAYYLAFDKLDEYGPFDAEMNEYWQPISIGLLKVDEDGSNPVAIFKEDVIFCPRTEDDGLGDPYEFSTGNVKKSLMLSSGDFILYTAETQDEGYSSGYFPKFIKVSKNGVVDLSFTIDGYADTLYENAAEMTPALDHSRLKVSVQKGTWRSKTWVEYSGENPFGVNGMIEMPNGKILIYGSFANIYTDRPIGGNDWTYDITHNIYDVGCFAMLNADGSLDTSFNNTAEMSAEYYPIVQNAPAPWDNGKSFRANKNFIAPVGFQYASKEGYNNDRRNDGTLEITFAKVIGDKIYFSLDRSGLVSYNQTHLLDGSNFYRINLSDLTLDETFDFRYFAPVRDIVSTPNGSRIYLSRISNGWSDQPNIVYNHRWIKNNPDFGIYNGGLNRVIFNRAYLMKTDIGLGGYVMEPNYLENTSWYINSWSNVGDQLLTECKGIFIFEMDEVNRGQLTYHVPNEDLHVDILRNSMWQSYEGDESDSTNLQYIFSKYTLGKTLTKSESDKVELYKYLLSERYTNELLWRDLSKDKKEPIDGVGEGWTPFGFPMSTGLNPGEYTLDGVLPEFLNWIPSVPSMNILKGYTASSGDAAKIEWDNHFYINGTWVNEGNTSFADMLTQYRGARDAKLNAVNELVRSIKPFTYASYHIPKANLDDYIQSL